MADPAVAAIHTLAKAPHEALRVVASKYGRGAEDAEEVCRMQLPIGLGGGACSVVFRRGMMMTELRQEVSRVMGWPADEQLYVRADTTQLLDDDGEVPVGLPPRCLRAAGAGGRDGSSTPASEPSTEELSGSEQATEGMKGAAVSAGPGGAGKGSRPRSGTAWADLLDAEEDEESAAGQLAEQASASSARPSDKALRAQSWAWQFMLRWRRWMPRERQHQFYIAILDQRYLQDHKVSRQIRTACGRIYKDQIMVRLRGRGSGFLEVKWKGQKWESEDPLMVCLSGRVPYSLEAYWLAFYQIAALLEEDVYAAYNSGRSRSQQVHLGDEWINSGRRQGGRKSPRASARW